jgi:hypothetical protein
VVTWAKTFIHQRGKEFAAKSGIAQHMSLDEGKEGKSQVTLRLRSKDQGKKEKKTLPTPPRPK